MQFKDSLFFPSFEIGWLKRQTDVLYLRYSWLYKLHWQLSAISQCALLHFAFTNHPKVALRIHEYFQPIIMVEFLSAKSSRFAISRFVGLTNFVYILLNCLLLLFSRILLTFIRELLGCSQCGDHLFIAVAVCQHDLSNISSEAWVVFEKIW